ncbi:Arylesterase [Luteitalea pratensis]|uniref:Arylesterase n=1 Tax=Luteitalea pratensis TaxID=1855912 RepID=A0A143PQZ6_LUTPR|nr:alpha/beta fold hydrolase [Luteitalea pratensis]AMY10786.1 Arylesterase [Luteitalea pratensis]
MSVNALPLQYARTTDGVNIAFFSSGEGRPIVFASNIFGDAHLYGLGWPHVRCITDKLCALGWRVLRHDHRGMGSSDRDVEDLRLDGRVRDLEAVVQVAGLPRFALVGTSIGAATAIAYAARHPGMVSQLVLLSPFASGAELFELPALRVATAARVNDDHEWSVVANVLGSVSTSFGDQGLGRQIAEAIQQGTSWSGLEAHQRASKEIALAGLLPHVRLPTLVIHEPAFPFGSFDQCRQVAAGIPGARLVIVGGRSIAGTAHDGHVAVIDRFLRAGRVDGYVSVDAGPTPDARAVPDGLTHREVQVRQQLSAGLRNKEIAATLGVAVPTIERHLSNLYAKIGARGRADATAYALRHGLDSPGG